jgi:UPF0271 protein
MAGVPMDLNADVGEGLDVADEALLPLITSANIGCGGHAGDLRLAAVSAELT